jgi:hypothetical protein
MVSVTSPPVMFQKPTLHRPGGTLAACAGPPPKERDSEIFGARLGSSGGSVVPDGGAGNGRANGCTSGITWGRGANVGNGAWPAHEGNGTT